MKNSCISFTSILISGKHSARFVTTTEIEEKPEIEKMRMKKRVNSQVLYTIILSMDGSYKFKTENTI